MRVALLTHNARAGDAIGRGVLEKLGYFLDRGAQVRVVVADERGLHPALKPYAIRQAPDDLRGAGFLALSRADLVVVEFSQFYPLLELLPLIADGSRRIVMDYHGVTPPNLVPGTSRIASLQGNEWAGLAGFADGVITHSRFAADELSQAVSLRSERVHRLGLPVGDAFTPGTAKRSLQSRLGLGPSRVLLFVARLAQNKRLPILISALNHLRGCDPPFHAVVVGPSGESYESERLACQELASDLGVRDRLHFLGVVDEETLLDCYRSADALVMPSIHEGFCMPVMEAMACGLPVIAARAGALPETVAQAGLTFTADDPADLAARIRQVFSPVQSKTAKRIAIVTPAYGTVVGGAERSLAAMATQLHNAGYSVEVFTTHNESNCNAPYLIRTLRADHVSEARRAVGLARSVTDPESTEAAVWQNSLRSDALIASLWEADPFDAVLVGPSTTGLSRDVVRRFGSRTILVPCLHDEPAAYLAGVREMFASAGGIIFHSEEERDFACGQLGLNHPNTSIAGVTIERKPQSQPGDGRRQVGHDRYVVSVGRQVVEKNLPELFDWARRYHGEYADRFRFVFIGEGPLAIPGEPWAIDLGRLTDAQKDAVVADSVALVQLSLNESLSLVVLEAQALGVPVIVNAATPVLAGHVARGQGGRSISNYESFAAVLNEFWDKPQIAQELGQRGQGYVAEHYAGTEKLQTVLSHVIENLNRPLTEVMREAGLERAKQFTRRCWRHDFERVIEHVTDASSRFRPARVELTTSEPVVESSVWNISLRHREGSPLVPSGPGRSEIVVRLRDTAGAVVGMPWSVALREVIAAGSEITIPVLVSAPTASGEFGLEPGLRTLRLGQDDEITWFGTLATLRFETFASIPTHSAKQRMKPAINRALALAELPDDYVDVTAGRMAKWKRWIKAKLLHNFKIAYVDVLSRQQSRFNRCVVEAIEQIPVAPSDATLRAELAESRRRCDELSRRIAMLEAERPPQLIRREAS